MTLLTTASLYYVCRTEGTSVFMFPPTCNVFVLLVCLSVRPKTLLTRCLDNNTGRIFTKLTSTTRYVTEINALHFGIKRPNFKVTGGITSAGKWKQHLRAQAYIHSWPHIELVSSFISADGYLC